MNIYPYNPRSHSARMLSKALGQRIKHKGSHFKGSTKKVVINWGANEIKNEEVYKCTIINMPEQVEDAANKLTFFESMDGSNLTPDYFTTKDDAAKWLKGKKQCAVVCRTMLRGHSGNGIVIAKKVGELVEAPLYVKYIKKEDEYRVHVMGGKVIDIQRKARRRDVLDEDVDWEVRVHHNGFIYAREGLAEKTYIEVLENAAKETVLTMELDFGAVDILWNAKGKRCYVLEVNTAPGLEGTTLERYVTEFKRKYK